MKHHRLVQGGQGSQNPLFLHANYYFRVFESSPQYDRKVFSLQYSFDVTALLLSNG